MRRTKISLRERDRNRQERTRRVEYDVPASSQWLRRTIRSLTFVDTLYTEVTCYETYKGALYGLEPRLKDLMV